MCAPLATGCVVEMGGTAEEGGGPWKDVGGRQAEGAAWGEHIEDGEEEEEVHQEGNEEETSSLEEEGPT